MSDKMLLRIFEVKTGLNLNEFLLLHKVDVWKCGFEDENIRML
jgi:hypothetical protein